MAASARRRRRTDASDQIGLAEGVGVSVYDASKGLVQLADTAGALTNPIEWAADPSANIARVKSAVNTVEALGKIAGLASPTSWITDPQANAQLAGALWHSAATSCRWDHRYNVHSASGRRRGHGRHRQVTELATDASNAVAVTGDVSKAAAITQDVGKAAAGTRDVGAIARSEDVSANAVARGEPYAFGTGMRSDRATAIIHRSARALGRNNASSLIDKVVYDPAAQSPFFKSTR